MRIKEQETCLTLQEYDDDDDDDDDDFCLTQFINLLRRQSLAPSDHMNEQVRTVVETLIGNILHTTGVLISP